MNLKKFNNILRDLLLELILNDLIKRDNINKYTTKLLDALKKLSKTLFYKYNYTRKSNSNQQRSARK